MNEFLRKVPLFSDLSEEHLQQLCEMVEEAHLSAGEVLFTEGDTGEWAYVIKDGQVEILKSSAGRMVQLAIRQKGDVIGEMALLESAPRNATVRARTDCQLLAISQDQLNHLLSVSPTAARVMLHTVTSRLRSSEILLNQSEKMAQLGTLTASMAHELNNPAAAAMRGSEQIRISIQSLQNAQLKISMFGLTAEQIKKLEELNEQIQQNASRPVELDALEISDRENEVEEWLSDRDIDNAWDIAKSIVYMNWSTADLTGLAETFSSSQLSTVLDWLTSTYMIATLAEEIHMGAKSISDIVKAMKMYVYLDQAPIQQVDVHESLENTLVILRGKLKKGITVQRSYDPDLPRIQAYGSELNQVWTNIIDNAIDAMMDQDSLIKTGNAQIQIHTYHDDKWVIVEIEDNGPGIPPDIQSKIFTPFFTTKPLGKGTGLGLNTSYKIIQKHGGEIKVDSEPGKTRFEVKLPVGDQPK